MNLKRLFIICFQDPRHIRGGVQRRVAAEVEYFARSNWEIIVVTEGIGPPLRNGNIFYFPVKTPNILYPLRTLIFSYRAAQLITILPRPDLIETHHDSAAAVMLAFPKKPPNNWVEFIHGVFRDEFNTVWKYERKLTYSVVSAFGLSALSLIEQAAVQKAQSIITVSQYSANRIEELYRGKKEKIHIIPNGIDTEFFKSKDFNFTQKTGQILLYVGRWYARKGVLFLIKAYAIAAQKCPDLFLRFFGSGHLETSMRKLCYDLNISDRVDFCVSPSDEDILAAYQTADFVCIPSLQEGQGIVALEAQSCGKPVIATYAGGLQEAVRDKVTGLLIPPGNIEAMAQAIIVLYGDKNLRDEYGRNAIDWANNFKWIDLLGRQESIYNQLCTHCQF